MQNQNIQIHNVRDHRGKSIQTVNQKFGRDHLKVHLLILQETHEKIGGGFVGSVVFLYESMSGQSHHTAADATACVHCMT